MAYRFNFKYRYMDDVLSINNPEFENYLGQMNLIELEIKDTADSNTSAFYLDLRPSIGRDGQLHTSIYDKRDDFNFHITNFQSLRSNIPTSLAYGVFISQLIRYAVACSSYGCFIQSAWNRHWGSFMVDTGILSNIWDILWPDHTQWQSRTDQTLYQTRPFTEYWEVSIDYLRRVWHADRGRLPSGHLAPSFLGACISSDCWEQFSLINNNFMSLIQNLTTELREISM